VGAQSLSNQAEISILSFGAGTEVYSIWGHTAIRVNDPVYKIDKVYNYGTYDFDTPDFLSKFIRGRLNYALSIQRYHRIVSAYERENRSIREQLMDLDSLEKNKLYNLLEENYLPENRLYKYDFFFDNCATRPLEIIEKCTDKKIDFQTTKQNTFRNILDEQLTQTPWLDFGIDLIIGAKADKFTTAREQMFMPSYFYDNFKNSTFGTDPSIAVIKEDISVFKPIGPLNTTVPLIFKPAFVWIILLILECIIFIVMIQRKKWIANWYDKTWFTIMGLGSIIILFMWFGTDHLATKENWNILWINPLFILMTIPIKRMTEFKKWLAILLFICILCSLLFWFLIPQAFNDAFALLILILGIKMAKYAFLNNYFTPKTT
jgi:hypothetical protein